MKINLFRKKIKNVVSGKNNTLVLPPDNKIKCRIYGNNNRVVIEETPYKFAGEIHIGAANYPVDNCCLSIGKNSSANGVVFVMKENGTSVSLGEDCMIGSDVSIWNTDGHSIYDKNGHIINCASDIKIGSHVWICSNVKIGKNTQIGNNCIIGYGSVVTHRFTEENAVIAGNPARIAKKDILWGREFPAPQNRFHK